MATQKEIALWGAFNLGHTFKNNMQVVKMDSGSIQEPTVRHTCVQAKGFIQLPHFQTCIQDYLKYYRVDLWGCPHCGKLYWYTQEIGQVIGEQAVALRAQRNLARAQGYDIIQIPRQEFYNTVMTFDDVPDLQAYNVLQEELESNQDDYDEPDSDLDKLNNFTW